MIDADASASAARAGHALSPRDAAAFPELAPLPPDLRAPALRRARRRAALGSTASVAVVALVTILGGGLIYGLFIVFVCGVLWSLADNRLDRAYIEPVVIVGGLAAWFIPLALTVRFIARTVHATHVRGALSRVVRTDQCPSCRYGLAGHTPGRNITCPECAASLCITERRLVVLDHPIGAAAPRAGA